MRQHQRVGEPVRHMEAFRRSDRRAHARRRPANWQRPGRRASSRAASPPAPRRSLPSNTAVSMLAPSRRSASPRQHFRQRIVVGVLRGIGLDGMHHGVDAGCRGDLRRQAERQFGSSTAMSGRMTRRRDAALLLVADRDDRDRRDLRAGAGRGRHQHQRQARALGIADAPGVVERLRPSRTAAPQALRHRATSRRRSRRRR